jgi:quercetin dioxygenase-like cupin family protein
MKIDEAYSGDQYKVLHLRVPAGGVVPEHFATSDAFVIVHRGSAELEFANSKLVLQPGMGFLIPDGKPHSLKVREEFEAYVVIGSAAGIEMAGPVAAASGSKVQA